MKLRPSVSAQSRTSRKSPLTPSIEVVQLVLPTTIGAEPLTMPVAAATPGILLADHGEVGFRQRERGAFAGAPSARGVGAWLDDEQIGAERLDARLDGLAGAARHRHHDDHRGDADDHAEHGEEAPSALSLSAAMATLKAASGFMPRPRP